MSYDRRNIKDQIVQLCFLPHVTINLGREKSAEGPGMTLEEHRIGPIGANLSNDLA